MKRVNDRKIRQHEDFLAIVRRIIEVTITTRLTDRPTSLILVAPPDSFKTTAINSFGNVEGVRIVTDFSRMLFKSILEEVEAGKVKTIIIPDLEVILARGQNFARNILAGLNAGIEEGIIELKTANLNFKSKDGKPVKFQIIASITEETLKEYYNFMRKIGFGSRTAFVYWKPTPEQVDKIQDLLAFESLNTTPKKQFEMPPEMERQIVIPKRHRLVCKLIGRFLMRYNRDSATGARYINRMLAFLKALAILRKPYDHIITTSDKDIKELLAMRALMLNPLHTKTIYAEIIRRLPNNFTSLWNSLLRDKINLSERQLRDLLKEMMDNELIGFNSMTQKYYDNIYAEVKKLLEELKEASKKKLKSKIKEAEEKVNEA